MITKIPIRQRTKQISNKKTRNLLRESGFDFIYIIFHLSRKKTITSIHTISAVINRTEHINPNATKRRSETGYYVIIIFHVVKFYVFVYPKYAAKI
jgi:hypothetical protein